jgi:hypothetical protein
VLVENLNVYETKNTGTFKLLSWLGRCCCKLKMIGSITQSCAGLSPRDLANATNRAIHGTGNKQFTLEVCLLEPIC